MTLLKKSTVPSLLSNQWLTDFLDIDRFFDSDLMKLRATPTLPAVNIKETEKEFLIELAAPGMTKKDFNISVENGILIISAESKEKEEKEENFTRREFNFGTFTRSFTLPESVNEDKIHAHYEEGILKLHLAKRVVTKVPLKKEIAVA